MRYGIALSVAFGLPFLEFSWAGVLAILVLAAVMRRGAWWDWLGVLMLALGIVNFTAPWLMPLAAVALWAFASRWKGSHARAPKWVQQIFYAIYPVHLTVIAVILVLFKT